MSVMDKLINAMKFNEDPYDDENEAEDTEYYDEEPEKTDSAFDKEDEEMAEVENSSAGRNPRRRNVQERECSFSETFRKASVFRIRYGSMYRQAHFRQ